MNRNPRSTLMAAALLALAPWIAPSALAGDPAAGKAKAASCVACHGADGNSSIPSNPRLAGQHADYLERALLDYRSGARKNPIMAGFAANLSDQDIADLAAWFASQKGVFTPALSHTASQP